MNKFEYVSEYVTAEPLFVAVSSKDGLAVDLHFGHTREFWIFRLDSAGCTFVEHRPVELYCGGQGNANHSAMASTLETVADCDLLLVAKVGDGPKVRLAAIGVTPLDDYAWETVPDALAMLCDDIRAGKVAGVADSVGLRHA